MKKKSIFFSLLLTAAAGSSCFAIQQELPQAGRYVPTSYLQQKIKQHVQTIKIYKMALMRALEKEDFLAVAQIENAIKNEQKSMRRKEGELAQRGITPTTRSTEEIIPFRTRTLPEIKK